MATARLFDLDPELLAWVPVDDRAAAQRLGQVVVERVGPGRWVPPAANVVCWGTLVVEGLAAREVVVSDAAAAELLGTGDVVVGPPVPEDDLVPSDATWTVLESLRIVPLEEHVLALARRWPGLTAALVARADRRADRLAVMRAISHLNRVDARVLTLLWLLADRWGHVTPTGIVLPLRLTHRTLAHLVGARRPSVSTATIDLTRRGLISRRPDGSWALHGASPNALARAADDRISATPAPATRGWEMTAPVPEIGRAADPGLEQQRRRAQLACDAARTTCRRSRVLRTTVEADRERLVGLSRALAALPSA